MTVARGSDGKWFVFLNGNIVDGPFDTNAEAWRALDRIAGEPINRSEKTSEWFWLKRVHGE